VSADTPKPKIKPAAISRGMMGRPRTMASEGGKEGRREGGREGLEERKRTEEEITRGGK